MCDQSDHRLYIGIDLGTSNTEITVLQDGEVITLPITQNQTANGKKTYSFERLPSLVCFAEDGTPMFGEVYRKATQDLSSYSGRVVFNTKRMLLERPETKVYHIPKSDSTVDLYSPQDIAALLLGRCAEEVREQKNYSHSDLVTISVPCSYQMDQVQATIRAARAAGFHIDENMELITEPVAALIEYIEVQNKKYTENDPRYISLDRPQNILVYDLGGGTLDLSVVRVEKIGEVFHFTELANNDRDRDRTIGGADFDTLVAQKLRSHLVESAANLRGCTPEKIISRLNDTFYQDYDMMLEQLHCRAYEMKHFLHRYPDSLNPIVFFQEEDEDVDYSPLYITLDGGMVNGVESLSYKDIVRDFLSEDAPRNILAPILTVLDSALLDGCKLPVSQVDKILITGGMCKFQPVRQALTDYLEKLAGDPVEPIHLQVLESDAGLKAVSIGAAYSHKLQIENHNEGGTKHYYLDVAAGLPQNLITRSAYRPISLLNPTEALFEIYCGTGISDPEMRKQYYYHKRFNPPLDGSAEITFRLEQKRNGEASLIGTIRQAGKENEDIVFTEHSAVSLEDIQGGNQSIPQDKQPALNTGLPSIADLFNKQDTTFPRGRYQNAPVYQGSQNLLRAAPEGSEKRLFLNSSSNHDSTISNLFRDILFMMDIDGRLGTYSPFAETAIYTRANALIKCIREYYWSEPDNRKIPVFQYAMYAMRQLPLDKLTPPTFPEEPNIPQYADQRTRDLNDVVRSFCEEIGSLLLDPEVPEQRREQLESELLYCITEWRWHDLFQLCVSIAQKTGSTKLAEALQKRLLRRVRAQLRYQPVDMERPQGGTQERIAQIYWNAMDCGKELNATDIHNLEVLLQGSCCDMDFAWLESLRFKKRFAKLPADVQDHLIKNNAALRSQRQETELTLDDVTRPDQLLNKSFNWVHYRSITPESPDYQKWKQFWDIANGFLDNPETTWAMVRVLGKRARNFDNSIKEKILILSAKTPEQRRGLIRILGFCCTTEATNKLEKMWRNCSLYRGIAMEVPSNDQSRIISDYLSVAQKWVKDAEMITEMVNDNSVDLLAALCVCAKRNKRNYCYLLSCIVATVPSAWISSQGTYGTYWRAVINAVFSIWTNIKKRDSQNYRKDLTAALHHLCFTAGTRYPVGIQQFDQALFNFCKLFQSENSLLSLYHVDTVTGILKLFALSIQAENGCPLSLPCQKQFLDFLNKRYNLQDMVALRDKYKDLLVLWYCNTDKLGQSQLLYADAFHDLVGPTPSNTRFNLQDIIDGI